VRRFLIFYYGTRELRVRVPKEPDVLEVAAMSRISLATVVDPAGRLLLGQSRVLRDCPTMLLAHAMLTL
jgi:hypothetical protein